MELLRLDREYGCVESLVGYILQLSMKLDPACRQEPSGALDIGIDDGDFGGG